jgi:hypothetical protein
MLPGVGVVFITAEVDGIKVDELDVVVIKVDELDVAVIKVDVTGDARVWGLSEVGAILVTVGMDGTAGGGLEVVVDGTGDKVGEGV